ncbi:MAG: glycosyltransferase [Erysipelotrichaceae bacterium]|nr:glycosyltransferase [Erysipelotrichaceae bacterium]
MTNILAISHTFIPSVLMCGHKQLEYLKDKKDIDYQFCLYNRVTDKLLNWADIIIFVRSESGMDEDVSRICKKANKHMIYVLDDDLPNAPDGLSSSHYYLRPEVKEWIKNTMANCTTFLTPSPVLLEKYGSSFKNSFLIKEPSLGIIDEKKENDKVRIGFAGSIDRAQDVNIILEEALIRVIEKYGDRIEIEFMGGKPEIVEKYSLSYVPYESSYETYAKTLRERNWDIGLAPMPETPFHNCKYINKYVEYASAGIAGIYSNVKPYTFGIRNEDNGLLVDNDTDKWVEAISRLIEDEQLRRKISQNCLREAKEVYSLEVVAEDYYNKIMTDYVKQPQSNIKGTLAAKIRLLNYTIVYKFRLHGWDFPRWAVHRAYEKFILHKD